MITREEFRIWRGDCPIRNLLKEEDLFPSKEVPGRSPPTLEWLNTWLAKRKKMRVKSSVMAEQDKKKKLPMCFVCLHNPPLGKCLVCGYSIELKDIDPHWKTVYDWYKQLWTIMRTKNMLTTGIYDLDLAIVQRFGVWSSKIEVTRDPFSLKIIAIKVNISDAERRVLEEKALKDEDWKKLLRRYHK